MNGNAQNYGLTPLPYDPLGQIITDEAYEVTGGTPRMNEQLAYGFDPTGNLAYRTNNELIANFQVNSLNELTANTNGGNLTVVGATTSAATNVTVNGSNALFYGDATFAATNMPLTTTYTASASDGYGRIASNTVTVSLATNVTFQYDANGNLTNDGLCSFAYDDENQLIQVWVTSNWLSQFSYDGKMRRRIRQEFTWQGSTWVETNAVYYVYDGNLVIQERDINNLPTTTYTRGKDLSGSLERAGGIGGLLARTAQSYVDAPLAGHSFYFADGNGNIMMLINSSQTIVAKYLYDAFGNVLSKSGLMADVNLYQFSSKELHLNSGLVYYLYRYYDPNLQRWPNSDPLGDTGSLVFINVDRLLQVENTESRSLVSANAGGEAISETTEDPLASWEDLETIFEMVADPIAIFAGVNRNLYGALGNDFVNAFDPWGLTPGDRTKCENQYLVDNYGCYITTHIIQSFSFKSLINKNRKAYFKSAFKLFLVKSTIVTVPYTYGSYLTIDATIIEAGGEAATTQMMTGELITGGATILGRLIFWGSMTVASFSTWADLFAYWHCRKLDQ